MRHYLLIPLIVLAGCANHPLDCATGLVAWDDCLPGTAGYRIRQEGLQRLAIAKEQQAQDDDRTCQSFGAKPGTEPYINCRLHLMQMASKDGHEKAALMQRYMQNQMLNQQRPAQVQPYVLPVPRNPTTNCTSFLNGQTVNTTCQ